jgi:hypothetical protein
MDGGRTALGCGRERYTYADLLRIVGRRRGLLGDADVVVVKAGAAAPHPYRLGPSRRTRSNPAGDAANPAVAHPHVTETPVDLNVAQNQLAQLNPQCRMSSAAWARGFDCGRRGTRERGRGWQLRAAQRGRSGSGWRAAPRLQPSTHPAVTAHRGQRFQTGRAAGSPVAGSATTSAQKQGSEPSQTTSPPATATSSPNATRRRLSPQPCPVIDPQTCGPPSRTRRCASIPSCSSARGGRPRSRRSPARSRL